MKKQKMEDMHLRDCAQQAINVKLQEDNEEMEEIRARRANLIIQGLKEPTAAEAEDR